jgi:hypothetical protein
VYVSNSTSGSNTTSFLAALENQDATQIVIADDYYSVGTSFDPYVPAGGRGPIKINRCGTAAPQVHFTAVCSIAQPLPQPRHPISATAAVLLCAGNTALLSACCTALPAIRAVPQPAAVHAACCMPCDAAAAFALMAAVCPASIHD